MIGLATSVDPALRTASSDRASYSPYEQTNITDSYLLILLSGLPAVIGLATSPYEQTNIADNV